MKSLEPEKIDARSLLENDHLPDLSDEAFLLKKVQSERKELCIRFVIFVSCLSFLILGRFSVPDNEPASIVDNLMQMFEDVNDFILHHTTWRDILQIFCSLFMDILFLSTAGYWVLYGKSSRLIVTILLFYAIRSLVQKMWFSPFPPGFWWYDPGFPSLVVPYGRGSDFFFSGHVGFTVICGAEWKENGNKWMVLFSVIAGLYTAFILLVYQVHYSIDMFTGAFFAHYCFLMINSYRPYIDGFFIGIHTIIKEVFAKRKEKVKKVHDDEEKM